MNSKKRFEHEPQKFLAILSCPNAATIYVHGCAQIQSDVQDICWPSRRFGALVYLRPETAQGMYS